MGGIGYGVGSSWQWVMHGFSETGYMLGAGAVLVIGFVIYHRCRAYQAAVATDARHGANPPPVDPSVAPTEDHSLNRL